MDSIRTVKQISQDCFGITTSAGSSFYIRTVYLKHISQDDLFVGRCLDEESVEDLTEAYGCFAAEKYACSYLESREQGRFMLTQKLLKKGYEKKYIEQALDYLEQRNYLDDFRFAEAWLRNRMIHHTEGRVKLLGELMMRGIDRYVAEKALDSFFPSFDETMLLEKAIDKYKRQGMSTEVMKKKLMSKGFCYKSILLKI